MLINVSTHVGARVQHEYAAMQPTSTCIRPIAVHPPSRDQYTAERFPLGRTAVGLIYVLAVS